MTRYSIRSPISGIHDTLLGAFQAFQTLKTAYFPHFGCFGEMLAPELQFSIAGCCPDMEKRAEWAALTSAAHFPISGRQFAIENGTYWAPFRTIFGI